MDDELERDVRTNHALGQVQAIDYARTPRSTHACLKTHACKVRARTDSATARLGSQALKQKVQQIDSLNLEVRKPRRAAPRAVSANDRSLCCAATHSQTTAATAHRRAAAAIAADCAFVSAAAQQRWCAIDSRR